MLYKRDETPVHAEGFQETTHFDIPASGKAFKSLIDNIYSRKIEAPIRELSTNAFDAHLEAGIDEPFRIKLPTKFDLLFMVRDYGLGMDHDFIMGTGKHKGGGFKSLFASTKDQDNGQVGMKGLGSKSPFAYTDSFILRVFTGTSVRMYSTYIGENGIPQLAFQGEHPSTERRGTAVQFPVQQKDIDDFYEAATRVLKGFDVLPEGLPATVSNQFTGSTATPLESGSFWKAFKKEWLGPGVFAKQGCVIYPIDLDKIEDGKWLKTLDMSVVIDFPIGSVQMVDSREFLAYDEETVANINSRCEEIKKEIDDRISNVMATAKTQWEIRALFRNDMFSNLGPLARSSTLYNRVSAINSFIKDGLPDDRYDRSTGKGYFYSVVVRYDHHRSPSEKFKVCYTERDEGFRSEKLDEPVFVYIGNDAKARKGMIIRAKLYLADHENITAVIFLDKLSLKTHRKLGKVKVLRVADLPEPPKAAKGERAPRVWDRFKHFGKSSDYRSIDEDTVEEMKANFNLVYIFQNLGTCFLPERRDEQFTCNSLYVANSLMEKYLGSKIIIINVRANEKMSRWPDTDFPRFDPEVPKTILQNLTRQQVKPLIDSINYDRFRGTIYDNALDRIGRERIEKFRSRAIRNPLFDLLRFEKRHKRDQATEVMLSHFGEDAEERIINRALELGLEVLPENMPRRDRGGYYEYVFPYPLLSAKWERMVQLLGERTDENREDTLIELLMGGGNN